jgi:nitrogen regulatory protein PII
MKLIECIIRPEREDEVIAAVSRIAPGMTVSETRGSGRQKGHIAVYRGMEYEVSLLNKLKIEVVVEDNWVDDIVREILATAKTGQIGDGRIFVRCVDEAYHVRTGFMQMD